MKVALISCAKNKQSRECEAKEMYVSTLFNKSLSYCLHNNYDCIFILSAKYGLLKLSDKIQPYDLTLNNFSKDELNEWATSCFGQLVESVGLDNEFHFFAGRKYYKRMSELLPNSKNILSGLGIGRRLQFLNKL